ncbi:MAG: hypothetical protein IT191_04755 [Microbacteriaceae bacterium]|nr:hypothetical protein [Microbacteriaceae bacterium]
MSISPKHSNADIRRIAQSAKRLGFEIKEDETSRWIDSIENDSGLSEVIVDTQSGAFGNKVAMLDFSANELARFRKIGKIVEITSDDPNVESALAISGSAAQSKIQTYPGDCDYFQRLNIKATTRAEAAQKMATLMRDKAISQRRGSSYQFLEAKFGSYPFDAIHSGNQVKKGSPISWTPEEVDAGRIELTGPNGLVEFSWDDAAKDPGWCKLDWVVSDSERRQLSNASNVIDVTWESPDGEIVALDGYLDSFFQEVYLDSEDVPTFAKIAKHVSTDALDAYVDRLQEEVRKYLTNHLNYGKAAKRMYNVFRLSGQHLEAAYIRGLFDEPTTVLYQVWSLISTLERATLPNSPIPFSEVRSQADALILDVIQALDGDEEAEIVRSLLGLKEALERQDQAEKQVEVEAARTRIINVVNTFFRDKLDGMPTIKSYMAKIQEEIVT